MGTSKSNTPKKPLTKREFEDLLRKAAQPKTDEQSKKREQESEKRER